MALYRASFRFPLSFVLQTNLDCSAADRIQGQGILQRQVAPVQGGAVAAGVEQREAYVRGAVAHLEQGRAHGRAVHGRAGREGGGDRRVCGRDGRVGEQAVVAVRREGDPGGRFRDGEPGEE